MRTLWLPSSNSKLSEEGQTVVAGYVGATPADTRASCGKCNKRPPSMGGEGGCPAWRGRLALALDKVQKQALKTPERYTLKTALALRTVSSKVVRHGVIGNPSATSVAQVVEDARTIWLAGLRMIGYDHDWWKEINQPLKKHLLASVSDFKTARLASRMGWITSTIVPRETKGPFVGDGHGYLHRMCPNDLDKSVTCNKCGICSPNHPIWENNQLTGVGFREKGARRLKVTQ